MSRLQSTVCSLLGLVLLVGWPLVGVGCGQTCRTALDCGGGQVCIEGKCILDTKPDGSEVNNPDLPVESNADGVTTETTPTEPLPEGVRPEVIPELPAADKPVKGDLFINEVLFDPPTDDKAGDANKDGKRDATQDDFVELVNHTDKSLDVTGVVLKVNSGTVFTLPAAVLPARTAIVIFGGGMTSDNEVGTGKGHSKFSGALVYRASLGLLTDPRTLVLLDAAGQELDTFAYGQGDCPSGTSIDQSLTRSPETPAGLCIRHSTFSSSKALFSPGTRADGTLFKDPPAEIATEMTDGGEPSSEQPPLPKPAAGDLVINEVLYDPPTGAAGDANKDGTTSATQDEFVEIVNVSAQKLDLSGVVLAVSGSDKFTFPAGVAIEPRGVAVIFGGGMTGDTEINTGMPHSKFSGAMVFTASIPLTNGGAVLSLKDSTATEIASFAYGTSTACALGDDINQSATLFPDTKGSCAKHGDVAAGVLFSPGTRVDGRLFTDPDPEPTPEPTTEPTPEAGPEPEPQPEVSPEPVGAIPAAGEILINEVLADPAATSDANKDGTSSSTQDEFVEIVNVSGKTLDMSGVKLLVGTTLKHTFPNGLALANGKAIVIFSGGMAADAQVNTGMPHANFGNSLVYIANTGLVLSNSGATINLQNAAGIVLDSFTYTTSGACNGANDQSVNRTPDLTPATCAQHSSIMGALGPFSPGTKSDGSAF